MLLLRVPQVMPPDKASRVSGLGFRVNMSEATTNWVQSTQASGFCWHLRFTVPFWVGFVTAYYQKDTGPDSSKMKRHTLEAQSSFAVFTGPSLSSLGLEFGLPREVCGMFEQSLQCTEPRKPRGLEANP